MKKLLLIAMLITALTGCKSDVQNNNMESKKGKVIGIGGVFFKAHNPDNTKQWYEDHLRIEKGDYGHIFTWYLDKNGKTEESTVWSPFETNTDYFGDNDMMINYIVDDMDAIVERLRADGVKFVDDVTEYEGLGKFVHIEDNESRRVELWEPAR